MVEVVTSAYHAQHLPVGSANLSNIITYLCLSMPFGSLAFFLFFKFNNIFLALGPLYLYSPWYPPDYPGLDSDDAFSERPS